MPHEHPLFQFDCEAVLFDLDGVLVDSRRCVERHWLEWAGRHQLNTDKVLHYAHGRSAIETIRLVAPQLDVEREAADFVAGEAYDTAGLVKIPGALENAPFMVDEAAYTANRDYAPVRVSVTELGMVRGQRLFALEIWPVSFNS